MSCFINKLFLNGFTRVSAGFDLAQQGPKKDDQNKECVPTM